MYADDENSITLCIRGIALALDELDQEAQIAVDDGDAEELARSFVALHDAKRRLDLIHRTLEEALAEALPFGVTEIPGLPPVEKKQGRERTKWDPDAVIAALARRARGDLLTLLDDIKACAPITPSMKWRVRELRGRGIDPDEFCESLPGRLSVQIHGQAPEVES
jgi:hypothetical protein